MITATVTATALTAVSDIILTEGMVGQECAFTFSAEWDGLAREVVFEGAEAKSVVLFNSDTVVIPPEVFDNAAGYNLRISAIGRAADGSIVIPTVWGKVTKIQASAMSSEYSESSWEPTPDQAAQIIIAAGNAEALTRTAKGAAERAAASAAAVEDALQYKQDKLTAGSYIAIGDDSTIDLTSGLQSWMRNIGQTVPQLDAAITFINQEKLPLKQDKLTAGTGITLNGSTISADSQVFIARNSGSSITTFDELLAAYNAGKNITAQVSGSSVMNNGARRLPLSYVRTSGDNAQFAFTSVSEERTADGTSELRKLVYAICRPSGWTSGMKDITNIVSSVNGVTPDNNGNVNVSGGGSTAWSDITGKPGSYPPSSHQHTVSQISDFPSIPAAVTDEHINGLIDAKIGSLEELSASVLELIGDEVSG